jgi:hypothetical protein
MLRTCVYMHSHFIENHPIRILEDGPLIFEVVRSQSVGRIRPATNGGAPLLHLGSKG